MTASNDDLSPWLSEWSCQEFLKTADSRVGSVGALLELRRANLWRVDRYTVDAWGVTIQVTNLPMPGFHPTVNQSAELSSAWEFLHVDEGRWQSRYGWKFLLGDEEVESVIAAGTEAAARGLLLTDSQVLGIFRWRASLQSRKEKNLGDTDFMSFLDSLLSPPPMPGAAAGTKE